MRSFNRAIIVFVVLLLSLVDNLVKSGEPPEPSPHHHNSHSSLPHKNTKHPASEGSARFIVTLNPKNTHALADFEKKLRDHKVQYKLVQDLTKAPKIFYGASIELANKTQAKQVRGLEGVDEVAPASVVSRRPTYNEQIFSSPLFSTVDKYPPHIQTKINLLHDQGIFGKGIKIALIDSGIDCTHPAFPGGFGPGRKLGFGRSYIDGDKNPCTDCARHGTHVAGIVAAAEVGLGFRGVAPNATIGMYRVFDCNDTSSDDSILAALIQAHIDGADIISGSFGQPGGWSTNSPMVDVVNRLTETQGAIMIFSAGNNGMDGLFASSSPASARGAISVGSVDSTAPMKRLLTDTTKEVIAYYKNEVLPDGTFPVYFTSKDILNERDSCDPLPSKTPGLGKFVVLIKIGGCFISEKVLNAKAKGAKLILFYMKTRIVVSMRPTVLGIPVAGISMRAAQYMFAENKKNPKKYSITFGNPSGSHILPFEPGLISQFSQFGPNCDFGSPQPAISGIGGNVVSTYPMQLGGYASESGTSMSAPQIAGIAALILSHRGKTGFDAFSMRARLATSGQPVKRTIHDHAPGTVVHQGGGLTDAWCAVMANTVISTSSLPLFDSVSFKADQEFIVSNSAGKATIHYQLTHTPAKTVQTFASSERYSRPDVTPDTLGIIATAAINPSKFSLAPGAKQIVKVRFTPPTIKDRHLLAVYSGFIKIEGDADCPNQNLAYYGVLGSLKDQAVIDRGPDISNPQVHYPYLAFLLQSTSKKKAVEGSNNQLSFIPQLKPFVWDLNKAPSIHLKFRTVFGSPIVRLDVMPGDSNPIPSKVPNKTNPGAKFGGVVLLGQIPGAVYTSMPRSLDGDDYALDWGGNVIVGNTKKFVPLGKGRFKLLMRALRVNGKEEIDADWDSWTSPLFDLVPLDISPSS